MSLKSKLSVTLAVGVLALGITVSAPLEAHATGNPSKLDQGDFTIACQEQQGAAGWQAKLKGNTAYSWKCVYNNSNDSSKWRNISVNNYCMSHWGVWAAPAVANDPYSWKCQGY